jgi:hypothetical protein
MFNKRNLIYVGNMKTSSLTESVCALIINHNNITARTITPCSAIYGQLNLSVSGIGSAKGNVY